MQKLFKILIILGAVGVAYIFLAAFQPGINDIISTANASVSGNYSDGAIYGMEGAMNSFPLYVWFLPGLVGLIAFVYVAKTE